MELSFKARQNERDPDFPRAIMHVDGDSFFVACEVARRPDLKGRPVVTGMERGIASAMSREAKARGITRGMRIKDMRRICPEVVILSSDYDMYRLYARRMYEIVRRYADVVEEYSIDECFADLTECDLATGKGPGAAGQNGIVKSYEEIARMIQADLHASLGITFSVGLGVNKVTAKIASKWNKPAGFTVMRRDDIFRHLAQVPIGNVWGIGSSTTIYLRRLGIATALDLASKNRDWIAEHCDRPLAEIYEEFHGHFVKDFSAGNPKHASIQRTRTFKPPSRDREFMWSQLANHVEEACTKLRLNGRLATHVSFFLKTQSMEYSGEQVRLAEAVDVPQEIVRQIRPHFEKTFRSDRWYRAAGISLSGFEHKNARTMGLFGETANVSARQTVYETVDRLSRIFGSRALFLGSSMKALKGESEDDEDAGNTRGSFRDGGFQKKKFNLIYLGKVI
jgi:DNA polymerase-4/DNA polymerase V